jgi:cell division protein FtsN
MPEAVERRHRRTPEEMIADLQRRIEQVKRNAERKKVKRDPTLRHVSAVLRSIDKALAATSGATTATPSARRGRRWRRAWR